ncbi:hypothetical protein EAG_08689 [Camponotus floridanus]|uniref:Uncharacterized protein n=1 Tax=Camponotus floridanus TaxID=104421 RepID=E2AT57_CAMFO|nr:hypothetical protein EAG_08689 [Camponotus floridanus]
MRSVMTSHSIKNQGAEYNFEFSTTCFFRCKVRQTFGGASRSINPAWARTALGNHRDDFRAV